MKKEIKEVLEKFNKIVECRPMKTGATYIYASDAGITLSGVIDESRFSASISTKEDTIYSTEQNSLDTNVLKESISQVINMYVRSKDAMETNESCDTVNLDTETDEATTSKKEPADDDSEEKEILLDDTEILVEDGEEEVSVSTDSETTSAEANDEPAHDIEVREEPIAQDEDLPTAVSDLTALKSDVDELAEKATKVLNRFSKDDSEKRSVLVGIVAGIYSISEDIFALIDDILENIDEAAIEESRKTEFTQENLVVPAKTDYMKLASDSISQACSALRKTGKHQDLIDYLKDIKSEAILRQ